MSDPQFLRSPTPQARPFGSPFAWGVGRRLSIAVGLAALLWLAVSWALGWWE